MNFEMTGKLSISKETDKFKPYEETKYESGWVRRRLVFNAVCGDNRHMLTVNAGSFADGHGDVYTFSKSSVDENGNRKKGEPLTIPFKDRLTSPKIAEVAEFRKYVFDIEKPGRRRKLEAAAEKIKEGVSLTDEDLKDMEVESEADITAALEKSRKKRHEFISEWDFAEFVKKVIDSGKYKDAKFNIRGVGEFTYSEKNQRVYESYIPNRIYLADENAEATSKATFNLLFNSESLDTLSVEEKHKYYVNGWVMEYDNNRRANIPVPTTVAIVVPDDDADAMAKKRVERIKHKFIVEDETFKEYGVVVNMLNGAQRTEITMDMLDDETRDDIECGLITLEDVARDLGQDVYGDRIKEYQFVEPARGFSRGRKDTVYIEDDMIIKPIEETLPDEVDDLFEDDDEL